MKRIVVRVMTTLTLVSVICAGSQDALVEAQPAVTTQATLLPNELIYELASSYARIPYYDHIQQLASVADLIVTGHASHESTVYEIETGSGKVVDSMSKTPFTIATVLQGNRTSTDAIYIMEHGRINHGVYENVEGYVQMNHTDPYLLFLRQTGSDTYAICGIYQGKFNIRQTQSLPPFTAKQITASELARWDYIGENHTHFNQLKSAALREYIANTQ